MDRITHKELPERCAGWLGDRRVEEVECIIADLVGSPKGKAMPWLKFSRRERIYLPTSIFYQTIAGDYVDIEEENTGQNSPQWTENDILLTPDLNSVTAAPWADDVTVQVIHDIQEIDGRPFELAPRNVLRRVLELYKAKGWAPIIAPEMEFYLTRPNTNPSDAIEPMVGRTGRSFSAHQAYSLAAVDEYSKIIDDIYDFAEACGFEIDTIIKEGGAGQLEINFMHGEPLALADQIFFFKRLIREAALRHNCFATFMAKPMQDEPGSAMHIHQSVVDAETGHTLFSDASGAPTELFAHFMGGQQTYIPSAVSLFAPYVNSFRRYVPNGSAPINLEWAEDNRTTGLRVPISSPEARRIENRVVGMDANPYLAIAASLACGFLGMCQGLKPRPPVVGYGYDKRRDIPYTLLESVELFAQAPNLQEVLGTRFSQVYMAIKRYEAEDFLKVISPWERQHLLLNV